MFETFSKKVSKIFSHFDNGFKELDEALDELEAESEKNLKGGIEHETVVNEVRPDGTRVTTRTIVRRSK